MQAKTTTLNERESRVLHGIERMIAYWQKTPSEIPRWELSQEIVNQLNDLKDDILDGESYQHG